MCCSTSSTNKEQHKQNKKPKKKTNRSKLLISTKISKINMISRTSKLSHDQLDDEGEEEEAGGGEEKNDRLTKARRHDVDLPTTADADIKLAEKLDCLLKIGTNNKRRYHTNKPLEKTNHLATANGSGLKPRNLTKLEVKERIAKKYSDNLAPELDPQRSSVKVVKVLSASESIELAKSQARKQLERQLELSSISKNQLAQKTGLDTFKFNDGYEMPFQNDGQTIAKQSADKKNSVRFLDTELTKFYALNDEWDDLSDSDSSTIKD